jgi:hypothetical protein
VGCASGDGAAVRGVAAGAQGLQVQVLQGGLGVPGRHGVQGVPWPPRPRLPLRQRVSWATFLSSPPFDFLRFSECGLCDACNVAGLETGIAS